MPPEYWEYQLNATVAGTLASCIMQSSVDMINILLDWWVLVFFMDPDVLCPQKGQ